MTAISRLRTADRDADSQGAAGAVARPAPWLIQGGMGVAISHWPLARAVARSGGLGVVSGTGLDTVFVRRLQDRGVDAELQAVLARFPGQAIVEEVLARFGPRRTPSQRYRGLPMPSHRNAKFSQDVNVLAAFVEVALAKHGHDGPVGINLLTKIQIPTVPTLFGAMLAGVDYVLMGAGVPAEIPGVLDRLARLETVETQLALGPGAAPARVPHLRFEPARLAAAGAVRRPAFLGIVASHVLARALATKSSGRVDGLIVEGPVAGGHNAPPRGPLTLDEHGNPRYGERDRVDFATIRELGLPFWVAGGVVTHRQVQEAFDLGATGVQVGTLFAFCRESGMDPALRRQVLASARREPVTIRTSPRASSTGYPFKVAELPGTLSEGEVYTRRPRVCDLGYLREAYMRVDGTVGYRCPAEPPAQYLAKGGDPIEAVERVCLCNALMATAGLGQHRRGHGVEPPIVTSGDCVNDVAPLVALHGEYTARDVIAHLR